MPRRRDTGRQKGKTLSPRSTFGVSIPSAQPQGDTVMSVSAREHSAIIETVAVPTPPKPTPVTPPIPSAPATPPSMPAVPAATSASPAPVPNAVNDEVVISPRVLDERAFGELSQSLAKLIDDARQARQELVDAAQQQQEQQATSRRSAEQLQERLRLSARMLKATQAQAATLHEATEASEKAAQGIDATNQRMESQLNELLESATAQIEQTTTTALQRFDEDTQRKETLLGEVDQRLEQILPRAEQLGQLVESAEVNIAALAHRSAGSVQKAVQVSQSMEAMLTQAAEQEAQLQTQLERVAELRSVLAEATVLSQGWKQTLDRIEDAHDQQPEQAAPLDEQPASQPIAQPQPVHVQPTQPQPLQEPPSQLQPPPLPQHAEPTPMPDSITHMVEDLRETISRDIHRLTVAVTAIASRVDQLQAHSALHSALEAAAAPTHDDAVATPVADAEHHQSS